MLKYSDNPPTRWPEAAHVSELGGQWWVGHTKARAEKAFAWDLKRRGINYFLPMREQVTVSGGRKRRVLKPLFTSYVFFTGDREQRYAALATDRLCQVIPVPEPALLISELEAIRRVIDHEVEVDPYPQLAVGQRGRITAGPFEGLEGVIIERRGVQQLVLQVSMLGQGAAVEIEPDLIEPIDDDAANRRQLGGIARHL